MSKLCFSFPAEVPPAVRTRGAAQPGAYACFGYRADVPLSMPFPSFSYPPAVPRGGGNRDNAPARSGPVQMPVNLCFRY
jgi:hypothetical protein